MYQIYFRTRNLPDLLFQLNQKNEKTSFICRYFGM